MRTSPTTAQIDAQMAKVQARLEPVRKDKGVKVDGEKAKWESRYATFAVLYDACREALREYGITVYQGGAYVQGAGERLVTRLSYQGEWIESDFPIKASRDGAQGFGGGISFAKRWGLCGMVGLVPVDDVEEQQGYQDNRPVKPRQQKAPPGAAALIDSIRGSVSREEFERAAQMARGAFPTGEASVTIERTIATWLVAAIDAAPNVDELTLIRDVCNKVKPRGNEVREALRKADERLIGYA